MAEGANMAGSNRKHTSSKAERLAAKILRASAGMAASRVKISVTLSGPSAASWKALQEAKGKLEMDDAGIMGLLLEAGSSTVRQALRAAQPE